MLKDTLRSFSAFLIFDNLIYISKMACGGNWTKIWALGVIVGQLVVTFDLVFIACMVIVGSLGAPFPKWL